LATQLAPARICVKEYAPRHSARCHAEYQTPATEDRALEVQMLLADQGHHRAPSIPDLIVAATAELAGLIVLHVDKDFGIISAVTGQPLERLAHP
jgi:predicted nucleic acid-binding protein